MSEWTRTDLRPEKRLLLVIGVGTGLVLLLLWVAVLAPLRRQHRQVDVALQELDRELFSAYSEREREAFRERAWTASRNEVLLRNELKRLRERFQTYADVTADKTNREGQEGRIDFKVSLEEAREYLQAEASSSGVSLPPDLGMPDTIASDEKAPSRIGQLATVVRLVELVLPLDIQKVTDIEPLLPLSYPRDEGDPLVTREFPVRLGMECTDGQLQAFLDAIQSPESFFTLRRIQVEMLEPGKENLLQVEVVCGAGVIRPEVPEETTEPAEPGFPLAEPEQEAITEDPLPESDPDNLGVEEEESTS